ncbi:MAG: IS1595 family transposase [Acidimicrobiia bacterium]
MSESLSIPNLADRIPDEAAAYKFFEDMRWGDRPVCPHCGTARAPYYLKPRNGGRKTNKGKVSQRRVWKCSDCRRQFSVLTGTIMHGTKIPVRTWAFVMFEMCSSKNGVSAREIERKYEVTAEAAWFMTHRIREAMRREPVAGLLRGTVIADETWIGGKPRNRHAHVRYSRNNYLKDDKTAVLALVDRGTGEVRSQVVRDVKRDTLKAAIEAEVDLPATVLHTDEAMAYKRIGWKAAGHESVNHRMSEYVRGDVTTNHAEGYFSQLKRSLDGTYHAVSRGHLHRYLAEFDFRYSTRDLTDSQRMARLMGQTRGRRLSYRATDGRGLSRRNGSSTGVPEVDTQEVRVTRDARFPGTRCGSRARLC